MENIYNRGRGKCVGKFVALVGYLVCGMAGILKLGEGEGEKGKQAGVSGSFI